MEPLIHLSPTETLTPSVRLPSFRGGCSTDWHDLMTAATIAVIPNLIVVPAGQRCFVQGMATIGPKG